MADIKENPNPQNPELSKEEMEKRRAEITAYYEEHIPALEVQLKYEGLLRDIEKCRAERVQAQMFLSQAMANTPKDDNNDQDLENVAPPLPKRTLKRVSDEVQ